MTVFTHVYRQPMTEATVWAYRETLQDLSVEELERGCTEAMKQTRFTPTPSEIREYGVLPRETATFAPPEPRMSDAEAKEFLEQMKANVPCLSEESTQAEGIIIITEEKRAEYERKKREAIERFGKSA
jgi:hypothetical protein